MEIQGNTVQVVYFGDLEVIKIYKGEVLVYEKEV